MAIYAITISNFKIEGLSTMSWIYMVLISILTSVIAVILFQIGLRLTSADSVAILSTFEPISGTVFGLLIIGETIIIPKIIACMLILISVIILVGTHPQNK